MMIRIAVVYTNAAPFDAPHESASLTPTQTHMHSFSHEIIMQKK